MRALPNLKRLLSCKQQEGNIRIEIGGQEALMSTVHRWKPHFKSDLSFSVKVCLKMGIGCVFPPVARLPGLMLPCGLQQLRG